MKKLLFTLILAATCILLLFSCKSTYPGNYNKYSYHGHKLRQQADSLNKSDTTGKCLVAIINGKAVLICK